MKTFKDPTKGEFASYFVVSAIVFVVLAKMTFDRAASGSFSWSQDAALVVGVIVFALATAYLGSAWIAQRNKDRAARAGETEEERQQRAIDDKLRTQRNIHVLLLLLLAGSITATVVVLIAFIGGFDFGAARLLVFLCPFLIILFGMLYALQSKYYRDHGGEEYEERRQKAIEDELSEGSGSPSAKSSRTTPKKVKGDAGHAEPSDTGAAQTLSGPFGFDPKTAAEPTIVPNASAGEGESAAQSGKTPSSNESEIDVPDGPADQDATVNKPDPFELIRKK